MKTADLKKKRITVFGLGINGGGIDTVRFLVAHGAHVTVTDIKTREKLAPALEKLKSIKGVQYILGQHRCEDFSHADMVIKTPGVPWNNRQIQIARESNVPVYTDASLFFLLNHQPVIGVTGSKGKTTTTNMIVHILLNARRDAVLVGAGQIPVLGALERIKKGTVPVFELSSWRLSALGKIKKSPHIAVVTNLLSDHGDYYRTKGAYEKDKFFIAEYQKPEDILILNADDKNIAKWSEKSRANIIWYSTMSIPKGHAFFIKNDVVYERTEEEVVELYAVEDMETRGMHNKSNMLAATAVARCMDIPIADIKEAVKTFTGVEHRSEIIATINGVTYINDTAATIPDAAIASIRAYERPIVVIVGGSDKNLQYAEFANVLMTAPKGVVFLKGGATDKILAEIRKRDATYSPIIVETMQDAVMHAQQKASEGEVVLLAPGAASFGIFANEFDRGDQFRDSVQALERKESK